MGIVDGKPYGWLLYLRSTQFYKGDSFPTDKQGERVPTVQVELDSSEPKTDYCPETEDRRPLRETWADSGQEFGNVAGIIQENEAMASNHSRTGFKHS